MATETGGINLTPQVSAAQQATNYLTTITGTNGISVHSANDTSNYINITSNTANIVTNGESRIQAYIDTNDNDIPKIRVGTEDAGHGIFSPSGIDIFDEDSIVASFGEFGGYIGRPFSSHFEILPSNMILYDSDNHQCFSISSNSSIVNNYTKIIKVPNGSTLSSFNYVTGRNLGDETSVTSVKVNGTSVSFLSSLASSPLPLPNGYSTTSAIYDVELDDPVTGPAEIIIEGTVPTPVAKAVIGNEYSSNVKIENSGIKISNTNGIPICSFSSDSIQIGKDDESHLKLGYHSLKLIDREQNTYLHISDLRDENGEAELVQQFYGDNDTHSFTVDFDIEEIVSIFIISLDDTSRRTTYEKTSSKTVIIDDIPNSGEIIEITYITKSPNVKAFTFGRRLMTNANIGAFSFSEGMYNLAAGTYSHAEGNTTTANGKCSHAEGWETNASGHTAHAEGYKTTASGNYSHAQNLGTKASSVSQTALGGYNIEDINNTYALIIGNGTDDSNRSNALTVDWNGKAALYSGNITDGTAPEATIDGTGRMSIVDKNGVELGYIKPRFYTNGMQYYDMGASRKINGSTVTHGLMLGIDASGKKNVTLDFDAWRSALQIVNILNLKAPSTANAIIDTSTNNGASSVVVFGRTEIVDKNGTWVSTYGSNTQTNGQTRSYIGCNNMKTDGTMVTNYLNIGVNKDGSRYYSVTDPAAFRKAIGGIGTRKNVAPDPVSCPNNTWKEVTSVSLEAGMWIVLYGGAFAPSATGHRDLFIGTSAPGAGRVSPTAVAVTGGEQTRMNSAITYNPGSTTTYKLYARQNSGGALNFWPYIQAVKLG